MVENVSNLPTIKKRSKGVAIFAYMFIVINIIGLISIGHSQFYKAFSFLSIFAFSAFIVYAVSYYCISIFTAVNVLKLKAWARRLMIVLVILGIGDSVVFIPLAHRGIKEIVAIQRSEGVYVKAYEAMPQEQKEQLNLTQEEFIGFASKATSMIFHILQALFEIAAIVFCGLMLLFFTRPKVKEQFMAPLSAKTTSI